MKKIIMILSFSLTIFGFTHRVNANTVCYDVEGEVETNNTSLYQQTGKIELSLTSQETGEEVHLEGTNSSYWATLYHQFDKGVDPGYTIQTKMQNLENFYFLMIFHLMYSPYGRKQKSKILPNY